MYFYMTVCYYIKNRNIWIGKVIIILCVTGNETELGIFTGTSAESRHK